MPKTVWLHHPQAMNLNDEEQGETEGALYDMIYL